MGQPFFIPTLMSMPSLQQQQQQQPVVMTASGSETTPVVMSSPYVGQPTGPATVASISVIQQPASVTAANLYLCATANNATGIEHDVLVTIVCYYVSIRAPS